MNIKDRKSAHKRIFEDKIESVHKLNIRNENKKEETL